MQPIVTDVTRSVVCVSVCWSHGCTVQKRLNRLRCRLGADLCRPEKPLLDGVEIPHGKGQFVELSGTLKSIGRLCCGVQCFCFIYCVLPFSVNKDYQKGIIQSSTTARHANDAMRPFVKILWPLVIIKMY